MLGESWRSGISSEDVSWNLSRISEQNLLAKPSRARADDVLLRVLRPRLVEPGPQVIAALKQLLPSPRGFADAYYFEATRDDALLAAFAEGPLFEWWERGRIGVDVESVSAWLAELADRGQTPPWTETIRTKVARGLLAALRDFGILSGAVRKEFARRRSASPASATSRSDFMRTGRRRVRCSRARSGGGGCSTTARVTELFHEAERQGLLRYSSAGSAVRVDWLQDTLSEAVCAVA